MKDLRLFIGSTNRVVLIGLIDKNDPNTLIVGAAVNCRILDEDTEVEIVPSFSLTGVGGSPGTYRGTFNGNSVVVRQRYLLEVVCTFSGMTLTIRRHALAQYAEL